MTLSRPRDAETEPTPTVDPGGLARPTFRPDIQGIRAIAVILVVLWHANLLGVTGGFMGVDVFFVVSGFVITELLRRQDPRRLGRNLRNFYARRIRRIVPAATLVLITTAFASFIALGVNMDATVLGDVRWASVFLANFRLINTATPYFIPGVQPSLINHFWSLAVEEQYYLVWPLVVFSIGYFVPRARRKAVLVTVLVAGIAASAAWSAHLTAINPTTAFYSPFTRFWELSLGGLTSLAPGAWSRWAPQLQRAIGTLALGALAVAMFTLKYPSAWPGTMAWWPCLCSAALLFTGRAGGTWGPARWLSWRPATYVGDISYSLYLWHFIWLELPLQFATPNTSVSARLLEITGALACAVASYHLLENPIRHSRRLERDTVSTFLLLGLCVASSWAATFIVAYLVHVT